MRLRRLILPALLAGTTPAEAGVHAIYRIQGEAQPLMVDVADNGDASFMQVEGDVRVVVIGDHAYAVAEGEDGPFAARFVDVAAALQRTGPPAIDADLTRKEQADIARDIDLVAVPVGPRTVRGVAGTAYRLTAGKGARVEGPDTLVMTRASELAPIGRALGIALNESGGIFALFDRIGPHLARWMRTFANVATLGAPVSFLGLIELQSAEQRRIPAETIALPSAPISVDMLAKRVREATPGG